MDAAARRRTYAMLALVMLLWAGNSIAARAVHNDVPPFTLAFCRWTGALLILAPFAWRPIRADAAEIRRSWPKILLLGAIGVGSFSAFLYSGLRYTTATNSLLIQAAIPAMVLLFDRLIFGVRPRLAQIVGVTIAVLGVLTIVFRADPAALLTLSFGRGDALIVCADIVWALYTTLLRLRPAIHSLSFIALTFVIGMIAMFPFAAMEWRTLPIHATHTAFLGIAYVVLLPTVVAYFLYNRAVGEIGAGAAGPMVNLQPLFGALLASLLLDEPLHAYHGAGMVLILLGIVLPLVWMPSRAMAAQEAAR